MPCAGNLALASLYWLIIKQGLNTDFLQVIKFILANLTNTCTDLANHRHHQSQLTRPEPRAKLCLHLSGGGVAHLCTKAGCSLSKLPLSRRRETDSPRLGVLSLTWFVSWAIYLAFLESFLVKSKKLNKNTSNVPSALKFMFYQIHLGKQAV